MNNLNQQDTQFVETFIAKHPFKFAKSMPKIPHEYVLSKNVDPKEFSYFEMLIKQYGTPEKFGSRYYKYLHFGPHKYWVLPSPNPEVFVLNRALRR